MPVRMSSVHFLYNYKNALNRTYAKQQNLFEQADGSKIHRGSDNPVAYGNLMRYQFTKNENETYTSNVQTANSWMKNSDSVLANMVDNISTLSTKANQAANTYLSETDSKAIAKEMNSIIEEVMSNCNYQLGDRFLFAGQKDTTQPFTMSSELQERGLAKNLDAKQAEFFKGTRGNVNTELYQMLTLEDEDGNTFYLDNNSGYIFTKDFVDKGYKDVISSGINYIKDVDNIDDYAVGNLRISEEEGLNTAKAASAEDIAAVVDGTSKDNDLKRALRSVSDSDDSDTKIAEIANATGATEDEVKAAVKNCENFSYVMVSDYFNNRGIINDAAKEDGIKTDISGEEKNLKFKTIMQRVVTYSGDDNHISMVKLNGATDTRSDIVNVTGQDLFGCDIFDDEFSGNEKSGTAMMNNCLTVYTMTDACDSHWLSSDGITLADVSHATLIVAQTTLGARLQLYGNVEDMLDNQNALVTGDITDLDSTDVAELATKLMEMTTIYNLALSLGGRVLPQSLADYL